MDRVALAGVVVLAALVGFVRDFSGDFHYHLVLGGETLTKHSIFRVDDLSHTFRGKTMFVSAWLGDVLLALAYRVGGYAGCYALRAACLVGMVLVLAREMRRLGVRTSTAAAIVAYVLAQGVFGFFLRPEMLALFCFALVHHLLGTQERTSARWPFVALFATLVFWANVHGSSGLGVMLIGCYAAERGLRALHAALRGTGDRWRWLLWALPPVIAIAATCINPEGVGAVLAFRILSPTYVAHTREWLPQAMNLLPVGFYVLAGLTVLSLAASWRRLSWWRLAQAVVLIALSIRYQRFTLFALIGGAVLAANELGLLRDRVAVTPRAATWRRLSVVLVVGLFAFALEKVTVEQRIFREIGTGLDPEAYPEAACRYAKAHPPAGLLLNEFDYGSYLLFCLGPTQPVFIDQRSWSLFPDAFFRHYLEAFDSPAAFRALTDEFHIGWAFSSYSPLATQLSHARDQWRLVYFDDHALVYLRRGPSDDGRPGFEELDPTRLGRLAQLPPPELPAAREELALARSRCPECLRVRLVEGALALSEHDEATFERVTSSLIASHPERPELAYLGGLHAAAHGDHRRAAAFFRTMAALGGDQRLALTLAEAAEQKAAQRP